MPYTHLTRDQRHTIHTLHTQGHTLSHIALSIGCSKSTISRELKRNSDENGHYDHVSADALALSRKHGALPKFTLQDWEVVEQKLRLQWSPEQVSSTLKKDGINAPSHERIYAHIWQDKKNGGALHTHLRHKIGSYKKRGNTYEKRGQIKDQTMIDQRPTEVETRERIGDWELDTIIGHVGGHVLVTMVERKSRYSLIRKATSKQALEVGEQLWRALEPHDGKVLTLTADNGKEFAGHKLTSALLDCQYFFAHPYHSWERGLNENTNGLIRQYFPKKSSFDNLSDQDIQRVQDLLNSRPRKCLDFKTPNDIFFANPTSVALAS